MWVIRSAEYEEIKAAFFYCSPSKNDDIAKKLLERFHRYLTIDAYNGYEKVKDIKRNLC